MTADPQPVDATTAAFSIYVSKVRLSVLLATFLVSWSLVIWMIITQPQIAIAPLIVGTATAPFVPFSVRSWSTPIVEITDRLLILTLPRKSRSVSIDRNSIVSCDFISAGLIVRFRTPTRLADGQGVDDNDVDERHMPKGLLGGHGAEVIRRLGSGLGPS
jgi:hypothetical protein